MSVPAPGRGGGLPPLAQRPLATLPPTGPNPLGVPSPLAPQGQPPELEDLPILNRDAHYLSLANRGRGIGRSRDMGRGQEREVVDAGHRRGQYGRGRAAHGRGVEREPVDVGHPRTPAELPPLHPRTEQKGGGAEAGPPIPADPHRHERPLGPPGPAPFQVGPVTPPAFGNPALAREAVRRGPPPST